jgi:hypothetical protein
VVRPSGGAVRGTDDGESTTVEDHTGDGGAGDGQVPPLKEPDFGLPDTASDPSVTPGPGASVARSHNAKRFEHLLAGEVEPRRVSRAATEEAAPPEGGKSSPGTRVFDALFIVCVAVGLGVLGVLLFRRRAAP